MQLTRSVKNAVTFVSCGGAAAYVWPGGGITVMVDVLDMPTNSFGYVPTPALVAPIEFTMRVEDYAMLGGYIEKIQPVERLSCQRLRSVQKMDNHPHPMQPKNFRWARGQP